jgi:hypothetical protein
MKNIIFIISFILTYSYASAQTPQAFRYQAVVRNSQGIIVANKLVAFRIHIVKDNINGPSVYTERHSIASNEYGLVNLNIGAGTKIAGDFGTIDWALGSYFIKIEIDINNGSNYIFMGTSQLLSVPFALYAAKSGNASDDRDKDSTNEIQNLNLTGNTLTISKGNSVLLDDRDKDSLNEIQNITLNNNSLQLSRNGGNIDLTKYATDSQTLSLNGNVLSISKGNSIVLSGAVDLDADPTNEIQNLSLANDTLKLSKANQIVLPRSLDNDTTNEIQLLQQLNNTVTLTKNGGSVSVPSTSNIQNGSILTANATGTNAIILTLTPAPTAYATGMIVNFKTPNTNTGHVTLNVNGLGSKPLFKNVNDTLRAGDIKLGRMINAIYDGNIFQVLNTLNEDDIGAARFVLDTTTNVSPLVNLNSGWNKLRFNNTLYNFSNNINRIGDTIILQNGMYEVDLTVALMSVPGYVRLRLKNVSTNNTQLTSIGSTFYTYSTLRMSGVLQVSSPQKFLAEINASSPSVIGVFTDPSNIHGEREILIEMNVKKFK